MKAILPLVAVFGLVVGMVTLTTGCGGDAPKKADTTKKDEKK